MLGSLFLFSGRVGRGRYFLWNVVLIPIVMFVALRLLPELNSGFWPSQSSHLAALLLIYLVSGWMGVSLQAARIRDIGWKPGMIILGLCAFNGMILAIDYSFPAWSAETHFFATFSGGIAGITTAVFLLMPSAGDSFIPRFPPSQSGADTPRESRPEPSDYRAPPPIPMPTRRVYPREKVPFGRRGLT